MKTLEVDVSSRWIGCWTSILSRCPATLQGTRLKGDIQWSRVQVPSRPPLSIEDNTMESKTVRFILELIAKSTLCLIGGIFVLAGYIEGDIITILFGVLVILLFGSTDFKHPR